LIRQATNEPALQNWTPITSQPVTSWRSNGVYKAPGTRYNGHWRVYATSNGSFYLVPSLATKTIEMCGPRNGHTATLEAEGAGIAATLFAFMDMAEGPLGTDPYDNLLAFAEQHPEGGSICTLL
jgi:Antirestriction protein